MPVTTYPSGQAAVPHAASTVSSPQDLLSQTNRKEYKRAKSVIQSSFLSEDLTSHSLVGANNGFVHAAVVSYSKHHHLSIRPEDIWITILIQFGLYVNANAERLRSLFVQHEGKKELTVIDYGTIENQDFGKMAMDMKNAIGENVVDDSLTAWIMPSFSTTTSADEIASAISLMSTLKEYFSCKFMLLCGLPSVTLLGEKSDWENILQRLDKLSSFGSESEHWSKLLKPILRLFVKTFDDPDSTKIKDFWQNIFHSSGGGSGPTYYSGWITAFAFWGDDGKLLNPLSEDVGTRRSFGRRNEAKPLVLDGMQYPIVDSQDVPTGTASVPVKLDDRGKIYETVMISGVVGYLVENAQPGVISRVEGRRDALRAAIGWWMIEV